MKLGPGESYCVLNHTDRAVKGYDLSELREVLGMYLRERLLTSRVCNRTAAGLN